QIRQERRNLAKQAVDCRHRAAWLILVEERLVRARSEMGALDYGDFALHAQHPIQQGKNSSEIVPQAGIAPHRLALGTSARLRLDELGRQGRGMFSAPADLAQIGA